MRNLVFWVICFVKVFCFPSNYFFESTFVRVACNKKREQFILEFFCVHSHDDLFFKFLSHLIRERESGSRDVQIENLGNWLKTFENFNWFEKLSKVPSDDDASSTTTKGKTWGPSSMSHQRERGFLPTLRPAERLHNLVKSAPNLDNKSRSSTTSTSTDNILGNSADHCDSLMAVAASANIHHYTNTNYHSIYYERDLMKVGDDDDKRRKMSSTSITSPEQSNESHDYDSDHSEHSVNIGCFSFVGNSSTNDSKKKYKKLSDLENRQLLPSIDKKSKGTGSRKNSTDPKKKLQFEELTTPKAKFNVDLMFYKRFEQSLDAVGSYELDEEDYIYIKTKKTKTKTKLSVRLQQSLDAIDSYEIEDEEAPEKIYSKSIDDLSTGGDFQFHRGGSQFTWECFLKNGGRKNGGYEARARDSESSQESTRKVPWSDKQY